MTQKKHDDFYYRFCHCYDIIVENARLSANFVKAYEHLKVDRPLKPIAKIRLTNKIDDFPQNSTTLTGTYKRIPWKLTVTGSDSMAEVTFYSMAFTDFLLTRIVILPLLKKQASLAGKICLIGSAFIYNNTGFILFGPPGSGKTTQLLHALQGGAFFLGDNELMIDLQEGVFSIFEDIELRYQTARKTQIWKKIPLSIKTLLMMHEIIACLSGRKISFNRRFKPEALGIERKHCPFPESFSFIHLKPNNKKEKAVIDDIIYEIELYESDYRERFGDILFSQNDFEDSKKHLRVFLSNCALWKTAPQNDIQKFMDQTTG
ncbi:MAG: hypothetical protein H6757_02010 [Candidatus Omnitrophica bacterium]|nr:hypothetical protein [Candidatus Omnitrophota bacterium]